MLLSLDHVTVRAADFAKAESFYCGLLGLQPGPRPAFPVPGRWFYLGGEAVVHVLPGLPGLPGGSAGAFDHFALRARGLALFQHRLRNAGVASELGRQPTTGEWQLFTTDPDGARVELAFTAAETPAG